MEAHSDDDFDHVRDFDMSDPDSESEAEVDEQDTDTPSTTPPRTRTPRPSDLKTIPCPYDGCSKTFNRNARLQEHIRSHTGERPFRCPHAFCPKSFLRDSHLKHHLTSAHSDVRKYKCTWDGCDKSFATGTRLRRHQASHEGKEKYRCRGYDGCNETFRKHETLRKHIVTVHQGQKPYPCDHINPDTEEKCDKAFDTAEKLKNHKRAMHDASRFSCTICITEAAGKEDVLMNMDSDYPAFSFATYSERQAHMAEFHPPTCPNCSEKFTTNKELTRHLELAHAVVDPAKKSSTTQFACEYEGCDHVFTRRGNLAIHIKTVHEKKKEFVCGETEVPIPAELASKENVTIEGCGRPFTSKASLIEHVRTAHCNLPSKRTLKKEEKRSKRLAAIAEDSDEDFAGSAPKKRATRKDKGIKKTSVLSELTGSATASPANPFPVLSSLPGQTVFPQHKQSFEDAMKDDFEDDLNQLSGSMTLVGDHLYHNGQGYHLVSSEDGSVDQSRLRQLPSLDEAQYLPCNTGEDFFGLNDAHAQPFFEFEHEGEEVHPSVLDPMLRA